MRKHHPQPRRVAPSEPPTRRLQGRKISKFGIASCGLLRVVESRTRGQISMLHCRTMTVMLPIHRAFVSKLHWLISRVSLAIESAHSKGHSAVLSEVLSHRPVLKSRINAIWRRTVGPATMFFIT